MSDRPWEETWRIDVAMHEYVERETGEARAEAFGGATGDRSEVARFISAAPEMARALLAVHAGFDCACVRLRASPCFIMTALKKAGVIP